MRQKPSAMSTFLISWTGLWDGRVSKDNVAKQAAVKKVRDARGDGGRLEQVRSGDDYEGPEESRDDNPFPFPRHPWDPNKEARCFAVATRWARSREAIERMADDDTLATHLVAAMNVGSSDNIGGDSLDAKRPEDSLLLFTASEEDQVILAAMSACERRSRHLITKGDTGKAVGHWPSRPDTAHRMLSTATTQQGIRSILHLVERRYSKTRNAHLLLELPIASKHPLLLHGYDVLHHKKKIIAWQQAHPSLHQERCQF
jgi:hypothetical protein